MFPPSKSAGKKPVPGGGLDQQGGADGPAPPGLHQALMNPHQGIKPGQGMNPMEAMMGGLGDVSQFAPPPPPPQAPMGPGGMPIGGDLPSSDPGMDPQMGGSSLMQALNMQLDPFASPPDGHGDLDQMPSLDSLLAMLAMQKSGLGGPAQSGLMPDPTNPGQAQGLQQFSVTQ